MLGHSNDAVFPDPLLSGSLEYPRPLLMDVLQQIGPHSIPRELGRDSLRLLPVPQSMSILASSPGLLLRRLVVGEHARTTLRDIIGAAIILSARSR